MLTQNGETLALHQLPEAGLEFHAIPDQKYRGLPLEGTDKVIASLDVTLGYTRPDRRGDLAIRFFSEATPDEISAVSAFELQKLHEIVAVPGQSNTTLAKKEHVQDVARRFCFGLDRQERLHVGSLAVIGKAPDEVTSAGIILPTKLASRLHKNMREIVGLMAYGTPTKQNLAKGLQYMIIPEATEVSDSVRVKVAA